MELRKRRRIILAGIFQPLEYGLFVRLICDSVADVKERNTEPDVWRYVLSDGWEALAGRTDADNDLLSLKAARANDLWFHVHGLPGSHVVLRGPDGAAADSGLIKQAAGIAAWHSKARTAGVVPVSCTEAKNVSKPRGAKPGTVFIKREKIIKVRPAIPKTAE
jgi:predicted ribosome quality control (RQC) complex YloA/Tae2 family protein